MNIKILLIQDDPQCIMSIKMILEESSNLKIVNILYDINSTINFMKINTVDLILLDLTLQGINLAGISIINEIRKISSIKIIIVSSIQNEHVYLETCKFGISYYLIKKDISFLPFIINSAFENTLPFEFISNRLKQVEYEFNIACLTLSERDIFKLLEANYSTEKIEYTLHKSKNTIKNQLNSIYKKLKVKNRKELSNFFYKKQF